jgi:hypothetical protein
MGGARPVDPDMGDQAAVTGVVTTMSWTSNHRDRLVMHSQTSPLRERATSVRILVVQISAGRG